MTGDEFETGLLGSRKNYQLRSPECSVKSTRALAKQGDSTNEKERQRGMSWDAT